jgi:hypothetical protein
VTDAHDVHIGYHPPVRWEQLAEGDVRAHEFLGGRGLRPGLTSEQIHWESLGLTPRWLGEDSSNAIVAIEPSGFHNRGAKEWNRFLAGARSRGEIALVVSMIGHPRHESMVSFAGIMSGVTESVHLLGAEQGFGSVGGSRTPLAVAPAAAGDLERADRDLALRLADTRDPSLDWWALCRGEVAVFSGDGSPARRAEPVGSLLPLLVTGAGEVVAAVWISPDKQIRHYVIPWLPSWEPVLGWLANKAIPEFVPSAVRRIHTNLGEDPALQTVAEATARSALVELDESYRPRRHELEQALARARSAAEDARNDLLYGRDSVLEAAVSKVLTDAGCTVTSLDADLGRTANADLLVEYQGRRRLVEVKSASGNAPERLVGAARNHLETWPELRAEVEVEGISLVINHQINTYPGDRSSEAYARAEFVRSLTIPVVTTVALFDAWRRSDFDALRAGVFQQRSTPAAAESAATRQPWWRRRRKH